MGNLRLNRIDSRKIATALAKQGAVGAIINNRPYQLVTDINTEAPNVRVGDTVMLNDESFSTIRSLGTESTHAEVSHSLNKTKKEPTKMRFTENRPHTAIQTVVTPAEKDERTTELPKINSSSAA